jgi:hypothetical protein
MGEGAKGGGGGATVMKSIQYRGSFGLGSELGEFFAGLLKYEDNVFIFFEAIKK